MRVWSYAGSAMHREEEDGMFVRLRRFAASSRQPSPEEDSPAGMVSDFARGARFIETGSVIAARLPSRSSAKPSEGWLLRQDSNLQPSG
jgi:hypothetical protein